jgi:DNA-binding MarR family transcriptional regulator
VAFKRAMVAVRRLRGRETHRPGQISYAQYGLLFGLAGMCERSARDLAEHADLTPATVAQMLEGLEAHGLVTRTRSEQDRRVVLSSLTERGEQLVAERHAQMEPRWRAALDEFDEASLSSPLACWTGWPTTSTPCWTMTHSRRQLHSKPRVRVGCL